MHVSFGTWRSLRDTHCGLLCVISDSIPLEDEIARRFGNFIFGCMHCNSAFISYVVRSAFTNKNSPMVRIWDFVLESTVLLREMLDFRGLVRNFFVRHFIYCLPQEFLRGWNLRARPLLYMRDCCGLIRTILLYRGRIFFHYWLYRVFRWHWAKRAEAPEIIP